MNEFVLHSKKLNIKNSKPKRNFEKFKNSIVLIDLLALVVNFKYIKETVKINKWNKTN